jgi:hypothetical protein
VCIGWMACLAQPTILRGCAEDCHCVMLRHFIALMLVCAMLVHCPQHMSIAAGPAAFSTCFTVERAEGCNARLGLHRVAAAILGGSARVSKHLLSTPGILVVCNGHRASLPTQWPLQVRCQILPCGPFLVVPTSCFLSFHHAQPAQSLCVA